MGGDSIAEEWKFEDKEIVLYMISTIFNVNINLFSV